MDARADAGARKADQIGGPATEFECSGWASNPKNPGRQREIERSAKLGVDRLAELLRQKRGGRNYREVIAEMASEGSGEVGASTLSRAEHGRLVGEDDYRQLCHWVGMTPS